jgi:hypothetical protein
MKSESTCFLLPLLAFFIIFWMKKWTYAVLDAWAGQVAAVGEGEILSNGSRKTRDILENISRFVSKEQNTRVQVITAPVPHSAQRDCILALVLTTEASRLFELGDSLSKGSRKRFFLYLQPNHFAPASGTQ